MKEKRDDSFELYNLKVEVVGDEKIFVCSHQLGHAFDVIGEDVVFGNTHNTFSFYSLASILPLLAAKQRTTDPNDWMTTDEIIACPDSNCGARFVIKRSGTTGFRHSDVTKEPLRR